MANPRLLGSSAGTCVRSLSADGFFPRNIRLRDGILASSNVYGSVVRLWDVTTGEVRFLENI
jgi:hypothetical protein